MICFATLNFLGHISGYYEETCWLGWIYSIPEVYTVKKKTFVYQFESELFEKNIIGENFGFFIGRFYWTFDVPGSIPSQGK